MSLRSRAVFLAGFLAALPTDAATQEGHASTDAVADAPVAAFETDEARVFLAALQTLARHHASALGDSALWHGAANGLLQQLDSAALSRLELPAPGERAEAPALPDASADLKPFGNREARAFVDAFLAVSRLGGPALGDSTIWERAIDGLLEHLDDPYSTVFTPAEYGQFEERNTGNYAGIGVQITHLGSRVTVTAVFRETPAEQAGMIVGDRIVWVEGDDATDWSLDQARDAIRGEPGSVVTLRVERDGVEQPIAMAIERDTVHVSAVAPVRMSNDIVYILVDRIARGAASELASALDDAKGARAIVIDLRGNPGGFLDEALQTADLFLSPGKTLASAGARARDGSVNRNSWRAWSPARSPDTPILVLVDEYTASAAEIIAGALQDHDRALVVGSRTFGKGYVQTVFPLPAGRQISVTTGSWYTPLGRSLHRRRHRDGTLKPEDEAGGTPVTTATGRALQSGGGVFPDMLVENAFLQPEERALLAAANEAGLSLFVAIEEYAFVRAKEAMAASRIETLLAADMDDLIASLEHAGIPDSVVRNPVASAYVHWRTQVRYLNRAGARHLALDVQAERDNVLAQALELARAATTQDALFAAGAKRESAVPER